MNGSSECCGHHLLHTTNASAPGAPWAPGTAGKSQLQTLPLLLEDAAVPAPHFVTKTGIMKGDRFVDLWRDLLDEPPAERDILVLFRIFDRNGNDSLSCDEFFGAVDVLQDSSGKVVARRPTLNVTRPPIPAASSVPRCSPLLGPVELPGPQQLMVVK